MKERRRVLVLRPEGQSEDFSALLDARGFDPVAIPAVRIVPPKNPAAFDAAVARARSFDWIVFTSANGAAAFVNATPTAFSPAAGGWVLDESRIAAVGPATRSARIAAVGSATRSALEREGISVDWVPNPFTTLALARGLPAAPPARILVVRAENAGTELEDTLRERGFDVERADAYRTEPAGGPAIRRVLESGVDAIALTSASVAASFVYAADRGAHGAAVFCIGPVTEAACQQLGLRADVVASTHTAEGLADALSTFFYPGAEPVPARIWTRLISRGRNNRGDDA